MGFISKIFSKKKAGELREGNYHPSKNPPQWLLTRNASISGIEVNEENALDSSAVFSGITLIAESVGKMPVHIYKRNKKGKDRVYDQPLNYTLQREPNFFMTPIELKFRMIADMIMHGAFIAQVVNTGRGDIELYPLDPYHVHIQVQDNLKLKYTLHHEGKSRVFTQDKILHINGRFSNGVKGKGLVQHAREGIARSQAMDQFSAEFFANSATPPGFLTYEHELSDDEAKKLSEQWQANYAGTGNRHKIPILEQDMKFQALGANNDDSQLLESRTFEINEISRWLLIPPHKLRQLADATFSNIEHQNADFHSETVLPWSHRIQEALNKKFYSGRNSKVFVEFLFDSLLVTDTKTRYEAHNLALQGGWKTINEVRAIENLNPIEGGDTARVPLNMVNIDQADEVEDDKPSKEEEKPEPAELPEEEKEKNSGIKNTHFAQLFANCLEKIAVREQKKIQNDQKKPDFLQRMVDFYPKLDQHVRSELEVPVSVYCNTFELDPELGISAINQIVDNIFKESQDSIATEEPRSCIDSNFWANQLLEKLSLGADDEKRN